MSFSPYMEGQKSPKKPQKTLMRYQGFSVFFPQNPSIWDPKTTKNRGFAYPPPKIIKNRLNFALSEKFEFLAKNPIFVNNLQLLAN